MKKTRYVFASLAALTLIATACGSDNNKSANTSAPAGSSAATTAAPGGTSAATTAAPADTSSADTVDVTSGQDVTVAVVTHGDGGVFWSVFKKGACRPVRTSASP
jgi:hypothetical protein